MQIIDCIQGSEEWIQIRLGKVTASKFKDVMAKGQGKTRYKYMTRLITEINEQRQAVSYFDKNMEDGKEKEPFARQHYEEIYQVVVEQVGFVQRDDYVGCSPDGMIDEDGLLEIKCPIGTTHTDYLEGTESPVKTYRYQIQGQLWITGCKWYDVLSYRPENKKHPHFIRRVYRDEKCIYELKVETLMFIADLKKRLGNIDKTEF